MGEIALSYSLDNIYNKYESWIFTEYDQIIRIYVEKKPMNQFVEHRSKCTRKVWPLFLYAMPEDLMYSSSVSLVLRNFRLLPRYSLQKSDWIDCIHMNSGNNGGTQRWKNVSMDLGSYCWTTGEDPNLILISPNCALGICFPTLQLSIRLWIKV